jgi:hypothetical protein
MGILPESDVGLVGSIQGQDHFFAAAIIVAEGVKLR